MIKSNIRLTLLMGLFAVLAAKPLTASALFVYPDADGDGYGDASSAGCDTSGACDPSWVADNTDCDDSDININPNTVWYADNDGDGFGDASNTTTSCTQPAGYVADNTDYDDGDFDVKPGNFVWYADNDGDGFGAGTATDNPGIGYVMDNSDCDDSDVNINPNTVWYADNDGDGFGDPTNTTQSCTQPVGYVADSSDQDDAQVVYVDADGDGHGTGSPVPNAVGAGYATSNDDYDDSDVDIYPGNFVWYADADNDGYGDSAGTATDNPPVGYVMNNSDCNDGNAAINPGATEALDGVDNNCDGNIDEGFPVATLASPTSGAQVLPQSLILVNFSELLGTGIDASTIAITANGSPVTSFVSDGVTLTFTASAATGTVAYTVDVKDNSAHAAAQLTFNLDQQALFCPSNAYSGPIGFVQQWASAASGNSAFMTGDHQGHLYSVDYVGNQLYKYDTQGNLIHAWAAFGPNPHGIAIAKNGELLVANFGSGLIERYDPTTYAYLGGYGSGHFSSVQGVAVDANGNIYAGDTGAGSILKFSASGSYLGTIISGLNNPHTVGFDASGNLIVPEETSNHVARYSPSGAFLNDLGPASGFWNSPLGVAVDAAGVVYVTDYSNERVVRVDATTGAVIDQFGSLGSGPLQFIWPMGIFIDQNAGFLYVQERGNGRFQKISLGSATPGACTPDTTAPTFSASAPANGSTVSNGTPLISASFSDTQSGVNPAATVATLDGSPASALIRSDSFGFSFSPASPLAAGSHSVSITISDNSGNSASRSFSFTVNAAGAGTAHYPVGAGQDYADLASALAAVKAAETALGGGSAPFAVTRTIDVHAGSYPNTRLVIDVSTAGGLPTAAHRLVLQRAIPSEHPVLSSALNQKVLFVALDNVTVDGLDLSNGASNNHVYLVGADNANGLVMTHNYLSGDNKNNLLYITNSPTDVVVAGNGFYRTGGGSASSGSGSGTNVVVDAQVNKIQFSNNTVQDVDGGELVRIDAGSPSAVTVAANVFYDADGQDAINGQPYLEINGVPGVSDDNVFYSGGNLGQTYISLNGTPQSLATWQTTYAPLDGNSVETDTPFFDGSATGIQRLMATSASAPTVERAQSLYGLPVDYFGKWRTPDAGFSEFIVSTTVKPILVTPFPAQGATNVANLLTITAAIQDPGGSGIDQSSVSVVLDGVELLRTTSANAVSAPTGVLSVGLHQVSIDADDNAGNHANQLNFSFIVGTGLGGGDTTPPVISGASPHGVTTNASPILYVSVTDTASGVSLTAVALKVDGALVPATVTASATAAVITYTAGSAFALGQHTVSLDVADAAGNSASTYLWTFDVVLAETTPPVISANSPIGVTSNAAATIYASVTDTASGVNSGSIVVLVDGVAVSPVLGAPTAAGIDISYTAGSLSLGSHIVDISADDALGNHSLHRHWAFTVVSPDVNPPVFISDANSPSPVGVTNTGTPVIYASVTDTGSGVVNGVMKIDGVVVSPVTGAPTAAGIDISFTPSTALNLGSHIVSLEAYDALGNSSTQLSWAFTVVSPDTTAPVIGFNSPTGVTSNGTPAIYASITDTAVGVDPASIRVKVDGAIVAPSLGAATAAGIDISFTPGVALNLGSHIVSIEGKDLLGNAATPQLWAFTVVSPDTTAPVIAFNAPVGLTNTATPDIYASVTDTAVGVDPASIVVRVDGSAVSPVLGAATAAGIGISYTASPALALGTHHVSIDAKDLLGNPASQLNWTLTVIDPDTVAPVLSAGSPTGVTTIANPLLTAHLFDAGGIDTTTVKMSLDGNPVAAINDGVTVSFTAAALAAGVHTANVDAKDLVGNAAVQLSWSFNVVLDAIAPTATLVSPAGSSVTHTANTVIEATLADNAGGSGVKPASAVMTVDGAVVPAVYSAGSFKYTAPLLPVGTHVVAVNFQDNAGNAASALVWSFDAHTEYCPPCDFDSVPPTVSNVAPAGGSVTNTATPLVWAALSDFLPGSGVNPNSVTVTVDGVQVSYTASASAVTVVAGVLSDGVHTVTVDVKDVEGNAATQASWQFTVASDVTAPVVSTVSAPTTALPLTVAAGATINVGYTYTELHPSYVSITVKSGGLVIGNTVISSGLLAGAGVSRSDQVALLSTAPAVSGSYDVVVTVVDTVGLAGSRSNPNALIFDMTAPTAAGVESPANGSTVTSIPGNATIAGYLSDAGGAGIDPASLKLLLDGAYVSPLTPVVTGTGYTVSYTATALTAGLHTMTLSYTDKVGNAGVDKTWSFTMVRDNTLPVVTTISAPATALPLTVAAGATIPVSYTYTEANPAYLSITVMSGGSVIGSLVVSDNIAAGAGITRTDTVPLLSAPSAATGVYDVVVTVVDTAGQTGSRTNASAVIVDTTLPTAAGTENPANLSSVTSTTGTAVLAGYLSDLGGASLDPTAFKLLVDGAYVSPLTAVATGTGYTVSYTAAGLAAGVHSMTLSYADKVGNAGADKSWSFTMFRDVVAPIIATINSPTTAVPVTVAAGATVAVNYTYNELNPSYLSITVKSGGTVIGSSVISSGVLGGAAVTRTDDIALINAAATGPYDVLVAVVDGAGNSGFATSSSAIIVDATVPVFAGTVQPVGGSTVIDTTGSTVIAAYISDAGGSGVDSASLKLMVDGAYKNGATIVATGTGYTLSFTATGGNALANGQHSVSVFGADKVGNAAVQKNWSFFMVRDNTPPVIQAILSPTAGAVAYSHATGTVDVTWSYIEVNPAWVSITVRSGGSIIGQTVLSSGLASAPTAITLTTSVDLMDTITEGTYDVQVTMQDTAIAVQQGTLTSAGSVVIDNTMPTASIVAPAGASITKTAAPYILANLADLGGSGLALGTVKLRLDGAVVAAVVGASTVSFTAAGLADGPHTVDVDLNDKSNNAAQRLSWSFRTDTSVPSVAITAPGEGDYVRGNIPVDALSSDAGSGVTRTAFFYGGTNAVGTVSFFNGTGWNDGSGVSPSASTHWDTTALPDGIYVLSAQAVDLVGNTGTSSNRLVTVDNTPPVIVIDPVFSPTQYQAQTITGQLTEKNFSQLQVNGILATVTGTAPNFTWKAVVPLISGANGITVTAGDLAGNSSSVVTGINYDPTATVHIIAPLAPGSYKGQIEIEGTAPSATRWMTFEVSTDGSTWNSVSLNASAAGVATTLTKTVTNGWRLSWDSIADGLADSNTYYLRNAAYDEFNQVLGTAIIGPFKVDNTAPLISYAIAPVPVNVTTTGHAEIYQDNLVIAGSLTETGSGMTRLRLEQYNSTGDHVSDSPTDLPVLADNLFSHRAILVTGYNRLVLTAFDAAGNSSTTSTIVYYVPPQNSGSICAAGGNITAPDGTSVIVPSGALSSCINISLVTVPQNLMAAPADSYLKIVGVGHQIAPYSVVFQAQAQIVLPYNSSDLDLDANGVPDYPATSLKVLFWDGSLWQNVGVDAIDTSNRLVTVRTNHLGLYALAADTAPTPTAPKVYLSKNPFRFGTGSPTSFVYEMPQPGKVSIRIYDITGDEVRTVVDNLQQQTGRFTQVWDGLNNFDRFVGTGAYFFKFDVEFMDGSKTSVTKAIGVLK